MLILGLEKVSVWSSPVRWYQGPYADAEEALIWI